MKDYDDSWCYYSFTAQAEHHAHLGKDHKKKQIVVIYKTGLPR